MSALQELKSGNNFYSKTLGPRDVSSARRSYQKYFHFCTAGGSGGSPSLFVSVVYTNISQQASFVLYFPYSNQSKSNKKDIGIFYKGYVLRIPKDFMKHL